MVVIAFLWCHILYLYQHQHSAGVIIIGCWAPLQYYPNSSWLTGSFSIDYFDLMMLIGEHLPEFQTFQVQLLLLTHVFTQLLIQKIFSVWWYNHKINLTLTSSAPDLRICSIIAAADTLTSLDKFSAWHNSLKSVSLWAFKLHTEQCCKLQCPLS